MRFDSAAYEAQRQARLNRIEDWIEEWSDVIPEVQLERLAAVLDLCYDGKEFCDGEAANLADNVRQTLIGEP